MTGTAAESTIFPQLETTAKKGSSVYRFQVELETIQALISRIEENAENFAEALRREHIPHLSFTQITTVESCEYRYYLQYILGLDPDPIPEYFTKGKLLHEAIAGIYQKLQHDNQPDHNDQLGFLRSSCKEEYLHHLENSLEVVHQNLWQDVRICAIEHPFVTVLDEELPPFVGVIDLVLERGDKLYLIDHKTGRRFYQPDSMQMALYQIYARRSFGKDRIHAFYDQYRWVENLSRIRKPAFQRTEVRVTQDEVHTGIERVREGYARIERIRSRQGAGKTGPCYACPFRFNCPL
ncbi:MAG: PD-(D/E)XK nuclease family protein [Anaerolineales bacterium]|nr:PD-(D/E)XK nuclease family protein [Anaerolineales bacterium]